MKDYGPSSLTEQLWRSALTVLFAIVVIYIAWQLIQSLLGPLIMVVVVLGIIRLAVGWRSRSGW